MANERLRGAIVDLGLTLDEVGERLGVAPKTVERWINEPERKPYRRFQHAAASLLRCEVSYLWPDERTSAEVTAAGERGVGPALSASVRRDANPLDEPLLQSDPSV